MSGETGETLSALCALGVVGEDFRGYDGDAYWVCWLVRDDAPSAHGRGATRDEAQAACLATARAESRGAKEE